MIETSLRTLLLAETTVTDLVGADGVWVADVEQSAALPYIVITSMSFDPMVAIDGTGSSLKKTTVEIDCYADKYLTAKNIAAAVGSYLKDFSGTAGSDTIQAVFWLDETDQRLVPSDGSQVGRYVTILEFDIHWT